jgi:hypothetical protein
MGEMINTCTEHWICGDLWKTEVYKRTLIKMDVKETGRESVNCIQRRHLVNTVTNLEFE